MSENETGFIPSSYLGSDLIPGKNPVDVREIGSTDIEITLPFESKGDIVMALNEGEEVIWAYNPEIKQIKIWINTQGQENSDDELTAFNKFPNKVEPAGFEIGSYGFLTKKGIEWDEVAKTLTYASLAEGTETDRDEHKDTQIIRDVEKALTTFIETL